MVTVMPIGVEPIRIRGLFTWLPDFSAYKAFEQWEKPENN
jgi:hypothetical protein